MGDGLIMRSSVDQTGMLGRAMWERLAHPYGTVMPITEKAIKPLPPCKCFVQYLVS